MKRKVISVKNAKNVMAWLLTACMLLIGSGCGKTTKETEIPVTNKITSTSTYNGQQDLNETKKGSIQLEDESQRKLDLVVNSIDENLTYKDIVNAISEVSDIVPYLNALGTEKIYQDYVKVRIQQDEIAVNLAYAKLALTVLKAEILSSYTYQDVEKIDVDEKYIDKWVINPNEVNNIEIKRHPYSSSSTDSNSRNFEDAIVDISFKPVNKTVNGGISTVVIEEPVSETVNDIGACAGLNYGTSISGVSFNRQSTLFEQYLSIQNGQYYSINEIDNLMEYLFKTMLYDYRIVLHDGFTDFESTQNILATEKVLGLKK